MIYLARSCWCSIPLMLWGTEWQIVPGILQGGLSVNFFPYFPPPPPPRRMLMRNAPSDMPDPAAAPRECVLTHLTAGKAAAGAAGGLLDQPRANPAPQDAPGRLLEGEAANHSL